MGVASAIAKHPFTAASLGVAALGVAAPIANALNPFQDPVTEPVKGEVRHRENLRLEALRSDRLQRNMAINTARLAAMDPHTYNQILAGRRLPRGSVVFGGVPRTDLMELAALKMSTGEYTAPD